MATILAIDDERSVREAYRLILRDQYNVILAEDGPEGLRALDESHVDLVLLDLVMPRMGGLEVLQEIARREGNLPVIVVTAIKSVSTAVEAMKAGAREYIIKPFDVDEILILVERTLAAEKDKQELTILRAAGAAGFESIVGESSSLMDALAIARRAMAVDSTVLITGESGTGKDLLARAIHCGGTRAKEALVPVSCCAIPAQLVESELFGHEKGAFTGAVEKRIGKVQVAHKGTLFLDEIGEMPLDAQSKLLRILQEGQFYPVGSTKVIEVDVRFVCATNRNLKECVAAKAFREDLFYRINVIPIEMPPLRRRREDIPRLIQHFIGKHGPRVNAVATAFDAEAVHRMTAYSWPGNVRELENVVQRVLVHHCTEPEILAEHLDGVIPTESEVDVSVLAEFEGLPLEDATSRLERHLIGRALERADHVQSRAAELLGTTRRILKYKMDQLSIPQTPDPTKGS
ncbi:MAG: sigma-54-dependent Fis family transcriptional regulator [Candidatus Hydrogenedentes bacterium]|nr:sigma-54-dependent Fis family transcriptional regulator [Candidatus Hydrogenedentota bacterium]